MARRRALYVYQQALKVLNAVDLRPICCSKCLRLFREQQEILEHYQQRLRYILVDEYQDTNVVQYLGCAFSRRRAAICSASATTINRSTAGARGCDNILRFEHDFPGAKSSRLERIIAPALTFWPSPPASSAHTEPPRQDAVTQANEATSRRCLAFGTAKRKRASSDEENRDSAARRPIARRIPFSARSFQMREFEERFIVLGLPYKVIGGPRFYERAESATRSPICAASRARRRSRLRTHLQCAKRGLVMRR